MTSTSTDGAVQAAHEAIDRGVAAWNERDPHAIVSQWSEDCIYESPVLPEGRVVGRDASKMAISVLLRAFPDFTLTEMDRWVSPDGLRVALLWRASGTFTGPLDPPGFAPTGGPVEVEGMTCTELRGGETAHFRHYFDVTGMGRQLAAVPPRGSTAERMVAFLQRRRASRLRRRSP